MEIYFELLNELGIYPERPPTPPPPTIDYSRKPIINEPFLGDTEWCEFIEPSNEKNAGVMDYDQEIQFAMNMVPIHRYSRKDRFRFTFYQLLGVSGIVPLDVKQFIKGQLKKYKVSKAKIWNQIRGILKKYKWRCFYNRIPEIIKFCTGLQPEIKNTLDVLEDFGRFHYKWDHGLAEMVNRTYFPNLRFIAFKLMEKHDIKYPYNVPLVRTVRKRKCLNDLYNLF